MSRCKHQSIEITEVTIIRTHYTVIEGSCTSTWKDVKPDPSEFHVRCRDCGHEHTYRYAQGKFSHWSKPYWLFDHMALIKYGPMAMTHVSEENAQKRAKKGKPS
jgi:predicted RNA-binding Zn-ribbon protein involved in translation (DUF1610 family)